LIVRRGLSSVRMLIHARAHVLSRFAALCLAVTSVLAPAADGPSRLDVRVKAAFLYRFTEYVDWPGSAFASPDAPFVIAVLGDDGIADELVSVLANRDYGGRRFELKRLAENEPIGDVHILFVGRAREESEQVKAALRAPMLVVTDAVAMPARGSTINFSVVGERIRFDVALEDAERRGLKLSSRLLTVAQTVRGGS